MNARHVLAEIAASRYVTMRDEAVASAERVRDRIFELLQDPSERNGDIVSWFVDAGHSRMTGDIGQQAADSYYGRVVQLLRLSIEDLHSVEGVDRDSAFYEAEAIMLAAAKRQAYIVEGTAISDLSTGLEQGIDRRNVAASMTPDQRRSINYDVKGAIKEITG